MNFRSLEMKRNVIVLATAAILFGLTCSATAVELIRKKNTATYIAFPIVDANGDPCSSAASLDTELDQFSDIAAPNGFADCNAEPVHIADGQYYLALTADETNSDYLIIQVKSSNCATQTLLVRTQAITEPALIATTVAAATDSKAFTLTAGAQVNNAYVGAVIIVTDANDSHSELRSITKYAGTTRQVTVGEAFGFTPAAGDRAVLLQTAYYLDRKHMWPYE